MTKPICTKDHPAPKGDPIYPGAVAAHIARPDWDHPETTEHEATTSLDFKTSRWATCNNCGGNLPEETIMTDIGAAVNAERERCAKIVEELVSEAEGEHAPSYAIAYYQSLVDRIRNPSP